MRLRLPWLLRRLASALLVCGLVIGALTAIPGLPTANATPCSVACITLTMTTSLSGGAQSGTTVTVAVGIPVTDTASLSVSSASVTTGTVTYSVYSDSGCTVQVGTSDVVVIAVGIVPASSPVTLGTAGTYYWEASYSGDATHNPVQSTCGLAGEVETVAPVASAATTITTQQSTSASGTGFITLGAGQVTDVASVTGIAGDGVPGGTVSFYVCGPTTAGPCSPSGAPESTVAVAGTGDLATATASPAFAPTAVGTYCFSAVYVPAAQGVYTGSEDNTTVANVDADECFTITAPVITVTTVVATMITPPALPGGNVGTPYSQRVSASGGDSPYTFGVSAGLLPTGLHLDPSTGAIAGTPTTVGPFTFTITATGASTGPSSASQTYTVAISAAIVTVVPPILPDGNVGTPYSQRVTASGGASPYTYRVSAGLLPTGLHLDPSTGAITGTPTTVGPFTFTITATGTSVGPGAPPSASQTYTVAVLPAKVNGYWLVASDGGMFSFGDARFHGSLGGIKLAAPIVGMAATPDGGGYWLVASDGGMFSFGDARFHGSLGGIKLAAPIVGMAATPDGGGYWLVASDGGMFSFGDARFHGSLGGIKLAAPIVGMAATPDGGGYWLVASDGGMFSFGDARFHGSLGGIKLAAPIVGMAATPDGGGYWLVASDGGMFSFGDARFHGSLGGIKLAAPIVGMAATPDGGGYWLVASDGGMFSFGDARFHGSLGGIKLAAHIVGMASSP